MKYVSNTHKERNGGRERREDYGQRRGGKRSNRMKERKSVVKSKVSSNLLYFKYLYVKFIPILFIVL